MFNTFGFDSVGKPPFFHKTFRKQLCCKKRKNNVEFSPRGCKARELSLMLRKHFSIPEYNYL